MHRHRRDVQLTSASPKLCVGPLGSALADTRCERCRRPAARRFDPVDAELSIYADRKYVHPGAGIRSGYFRAGRGTPAGR